MKRLSFWIIPLLLALTVVSVEAQGGRQAQAELKDANGQTVGLVNFVQNGNGVEITLQVNNLPPGPHGVHVHAVGQCDAPEFTSAGGHFNPGGVQHGLENSAGPHAGDWPNLEVGQDGQGQLAYFNDRISLSDGPNSLFDGDGSAVVIHAGPDDQISDPAGDSGARIACGLVMAVPASLPATGGALAPWVWWLIAAGVCLLVTGLALQWRKGMVSFLS